MTAEVFGVCVLTSVLDLILCKCLSAQNINQRINWILRCWLFMLFENLKTS